MNDEGMLNVDALAHLSMPELKKHYVELLGASPLDRAGRDFLTGNIAWTLQVREMGQDPAKVRAQLTTAVGRRAISPKTRYLPGTRLIREWQGVTHEVVVEENGFRWRNHQFRSLSNIAREITGARWSGPRFFGLKERASSGPAGEVPER